MAEDNLERLDHFKIRSYITITGIEDNYNCKVTVHIDELEGKFIFKRYNQI